MAEPDAVLERLGARAVWRYGRREGGATSIFSVRGRAALPGSAQTRLQLGVAASGDTPACRCPL